VLEGCPPRIQRRSVRTWPVLKCSNRGRRRRARTLDRRLHFRPPTMRVTLSYCSTSFARCFRQGSPTDAADPSRPQGHNQLGMLLAISSSSAAMVAFRAGHPRRCGDECGSRARITARQGSGRESRRPEATNFDERHATLDPASPRTWRKTAKCEKDVETVLDRAAP
jgi:hypothetical protein